MDAIATILIKLAGSVSLALIKKGYKTLLEVPTFKKAAEETANAFPEYELSDSLRKWFDSDGFDGLFARAKAGQRPIVDAEIAKSFIENGGFYAGQATETEAIRILAAFFQYLDAEIFKSSEGLVTMARRQEVLHEKSIEKMTEVVKPMSDKMSKIENLLVGLCKSVVVQL